MRLHRRHCRNQHWWCDHRWRNDESGKRDWHCARDRFECVPWSVSGASLQGSYFLTQSRQVDKVLRQRFGMETCNPETPAVVKRDLHQFKDSERVPASEYQKMLGTIMYLRIGTRPDIAHAISGLSQYNKDPRAVHITAVKWVIQYTKKMLKMGLYPSCDASWCATADHKSFTGYVAKLGDSLITRVGCTVDYEIGTHCMIWRDNRTKWLICFLEELGRSMYASRLIKICTESSSDRLGQRSQAPFPHQAFWSTLATFPWQVSRCATSVLWIWKPIY